MTGRHDTNVTGILWRRTSVDTDLDAAVLTVLRGAGHPLPAKAIGEKVGIRSTARVRRILRRLKAASTVTQLECRECGETEYVAR